MNAIVYDPPTEGFPFIAVVFTRDMEVVVARAVTSREAGEALIAKVFLDFQMGRR